MRLPPEMGESRMLIDAYCHIDVKSTSPDSKTKQEIKANTSSGVLFLNYMISGDTTHDFFLLFFSGGGKMRLLKIGL